MNKIAFIGNFNKYARSYSNSHILDNINDANITGIFIGGEKTKEEQL